MQQRTFAKSLLLCNIAITQTPEIFVLYQFNSCGTIHRYLKCW